MTDCCPVERCADKVLCSYNTLGCVNVLRRSGLLLVLKVTVYHGQYVDRLSELPVFSPHYLLVVAR